MLVTLVTAFSPGSVRDDEAGDPSSAGAGISSARSLSSVAAGEGARSAGDSSCAGDLAVAVVFLLPACKFIFILNSKLRGANDFWRFVSEVDFSSILSIFGGLLDLGGHLMLAQVALRLKFGRVLELLENSDERLEVDWLSILE